MINFVRPKYIAMRQKNLSKPFKWVLKATIFSSLEEEERKKRLEARKRKISTYATRNRKSLLEIDIENGSNENNETYWSTAEKRLSAPAITSQRFETQSNQPQQQQSQNDPNPAFAALSPLSLTALMASDKLLDNDISWIVF